MGHGYKITSQDLRNKKQKGHIYIYIGLPVETKIGKYEIGKNAKMIFEICKNAKMKFESWQKRIKVKTN